MNNNEIASILEEMGTLLELRGENPFKCRAYHNAARTVESLTEDLNTVLQENRLESIPGVGKGLAKEISDLLTKGKSSAHQELKRSLPSGLLGMLRIEGLGPKRIKLLHEKLNISTIAGLRKAAEQHKLSAVEGFGKKTEESILRGIEALSKRSDKYLISTAREAAERILERLKSADGVIECSIAGSLRRKKEIIGDIDILISAKPKAIPIIMKLFTSHSDVERITGQGETKSSVILQSGIHCDLRVVKEREFPFALAYFTGSKDHNVAMRSRAKTFGWSLNEYEFSVLPETRSKKAPPVCKTESDIYSALRLTYIPPELRENMGELEASEKNTLPKLLEESEIRGTFHCHTTYSDGTNSLEQMAEAAQTLGWEYLGIADHSKIAAYAGGLSAEKVKQQEREIDILNKRFKGFRLFKGTEVDILPDGSLDWNDSVLKTFDYVVASIHSAFKMSETEATKRIIKSLKNKYVTMLGHPTGRLLLQRDGYPVNMVQVINAASDYGKIIEINSHPMRLDIDWRFCKYAKEKGVKISINPDAHNVHGLRDVGYGVGTARKGWLEKSDIVNTRSLRDVVQFMNRT